MALSAVPSSAAETGHVNKHKPHWQQQIMRMAACLPGGGENNLPVFLDVMRSHRHQWFFCRSGGHFEVPMFGVVVLVLLRGLLLWLRPWKVVWEAICHWCYLAAAEGSNWTTTPWLCKANDTGQRERGCWASSSCVLSSALSVNAMGDVNSVGGNGGGGRGCPYCFGD